MTPRPSYRSVHYVLPPCDRKAKFQTRFGPKPAGTVRTQFPGCTHHPSRIFAGGRYSGRSVARSTGWSRESRPRSDLSPHFALPGESMRSHVRAHATQAERPPRCTPRHAKAVAFHTRCWPLAHALVLSSATILFPVQKWAAEAIGPEWWSPIHAQGTPRWGMAAWRGDLGSSNSG